jgi:hypothetical protein
MRMEAPGSSISLVFNPHSGTLRADHEQRQGYPGGHDESIIFSVIVIALKMVYIQIL